MKLHTVSARIRVLESKKGSGAIPAAAGGSARRVLQVEAAEPQCPQLLSPSSQLPAHPLLHIRPRI